MPITIGYTEYDAALSFNWRMQAAKTTGIIVRTRVLRNTRFLKDLYEMRDRVVLHAIFSGYEGTIYEPGIPEIEAKMEALFAISERCLRADQIVLRIDPVIPTQDGMNRLAKVLDFAPANIRVRMDFIKNTEKLMESNKKLEAAGHRPLRLPWETVGVPVQYKTATIAFLGKWADKFRSFHFCCEPYVSSIFRAGCISKDDYTAMNIPKQYYGDYVAKDDSCCCARSKVCLYDPLAIAKCLWNHNL